MLTSYTAHSTPPRGRVLVTDHVHDCLPEGLRARGYHIDYRPKIDTAATRAIIANYTGLVINSKIDVDRVMLDAGSQLEFIARLGSGREIVDIPYAEQRGVYCIFSPEGNRNAVAEQALGMLLALYQKLPAAGASVRRGEWTRETYRGRELAGSTIGIIGLGHTGRQLARKLAGMDVTVLAHDKYLTDYATDLPYVQETSLEHLQSAADVISLHLPLTPETIDYVDAAFLTQCRPGVVLLNTARGRNIVLPDLLDALEGGLVGGACLDVLPNEKPDTYSDEERVLYQRLYDTPNVILTPHVAGWTVESKRRLSEVILEKWDARFG